MKVDPNKLLWIPSLFKNQPELMETVLDLDITDTKPNYIQPEDIPILRKLHTKCNCEGGHFYWQSEDIEGNDVEVFSCDCCGNWAMSVTY